MAFCAAAPQALKDNCRQRKRKSERSDKYCVPSLTTLPQIYKVLYHWSFMGFVLFCREGGILKKTHLCIKANDDSFYNAEVVVSHSIRHWEFIMPSIKSLRFLMGDRVIFPRVYFCFEGPFISVDSYLSSGRDEIVRACSAAKLYFQPLFPPPEPIYSRLYIGTVGWTGNLIQYVQNWDARCCAS